jgi:hypothetical protein
MPYTHVVDHAHDIYSLTQTRTHALCNSSHITVLRSLIFVFMTFWCCSVFSLRLLYCVHCPLPVCWFCAQNAKLVTHPNCRTRLDGKWLSLFFFLPLTWGIVRSVLWSHCLNSTRRPLDMMLFLPGPNQLLKRVKFTLEQAMENQRVSRDIAVLFL